METLIVIIMILLVGMGYILTEIVRYLKLISQEQFATNQHLLDIKNSLHRKG